MVSCTNATALSDQNWSPVSKNSYILQPKEPAVQKGNFAKSTLKLANRPSRPYNWETMTNHFDWVQIYLPAIPMASPMTNSCYSCGYINNSHNCTLKGNFQCNASFFRLAHLCCSFCFPLRSSFPLSPQVAHTTPKPLSDQLYIRESVLLLFVSFLILLEQASSDGVYDLLQLCACVSST